MTYYRYGKADFEGLTIGDTAVYSFLNRTGGNSDATVVAVGNDGGTPHSGTRMARAEYTGFSNFRSLGMAVSAKCASEFFIRSWFKFGANYRTSFSGGSGAHLHRFFHVFDPDNPFDGDGWMGISEISDSWWSSYIQTPSGTLGGGVTGAEGEWTRPANGVWFMMEHYCNFVTGVTRTRGGTSTTPGGNPIRMDTVCDYTGVGTSGYGENGGDFRWNQFDFISNTAWNSPPADGTNDEMFIDDIELFVDRNDVGDGTATTGNMLDGTIMASEGGGGGGGSALNEGGWSPGMEAQSTPLKISRW